MERVIQRAARIREYLQLVRSIQHNCLERFSSDPIYRGALLHYLYLLADTCIVLAELVISHKKLRVPQSYAEAFYILGDNQVINPDFAYGFAKIAGFRNFLAHDYENIDPDFICTQILSKLPDIERFLNEIETALS